MGEIIDYTFPKFYGVLMGDHTKPGETDLPLMQRGTEGRTQITCGNTHLPLMQRGIEVDHKQPGETHASLTLRGVDGDYIQSEKDTSLTLRGAEGKLQTDWINTYMFF